MKRESYFALRNREIASIKITMGPWSSIDPFPMSLQ